MTIETQDIPGFRHEAGGHRIQRIPENEKRGRVHSSTVTVSVLNEAETANADLMRRGKEDFTYRWFSGTGKGGQNRNKVQACLELTHRPTGTSVTIQGRSRVANEREAMDALVAKLAATAGSARHAATNDVRSKQIGTGMRGDKRRTLRFQDDAVVDHVTGKTCKASQFMRGNIDLLW